MDESRPLPEEKTRPLSSAAVPTASPAAVAQHRRRKSSLGDGEFGTYRKTDHVGVVHQDAARRLAQVIESQNNTTYDEVLYDDDDLGLEFGSLRTLLPGLGTHNNGSRRTHRTPPAPLGQNFVQYTPSFLLTSNGQSENTSQPTVVALEADMPEPASIVNTPVGTPTLKAGEHRRFPGSDPLYLKDLGNELDEYGLRDELDILQEENEVLLEKLREAEKNCKEAEARAKFYERQVASLGEGAFLETKSSHRRQEELRRREEALRAARQNRVGKEEIANLHSEMKSLRKEAAESMHKLQKAESEAKTLRTMTQMMILTHEEMEEVVLKRCWLARYWGLAVQYGICADMAGSKYEFWSAFAPLPFEVVISAAQKAKEYFLRKDENDSTGLNKCCQDPGDLAGEGNIETMLSVEMGLKEMASLKIEDAVMLSMVRRRRPNLVQDYNVAGDPKFVDSFELSQEETNDVRFKQAWLTYFWKRARDHQVEEDIAEERLQLWIGRIGESPTLQDAVDVEHGLIELRKLGIQQQLWEACRKEVVYPSSIEAENEKYATESENSP